MSRMKKIMALLLTVVLAMAFTACGSKSEPAEEPAEEPAAEETFGDFDISAGLTQINNEETGEATIETDYFTVTLPDADQWAYEVDGQTSITFYHIASRDAGVGGRLFSVEVFAPDDESYDPMPFEVLGEKDGMKFVVTYPSDVQADVENEENNAEYQKLFEIAHSVKADDSSSPVVLK